MGHRAVSGTRGDDRDTGPGVQERAVGRPRYSVVAWLIAGELGVGCRHRAGKGIIHARLGRRALLYNLQVSLEVRVFCLKVCQTAFEAGDDLLVRLIGNGAYVEGHVGARRDDVYLRVAALRAEQDGRGDARVAEKGVFAVTRDFLLL